KRMSVGVVDVERQVPSQSLGDRYLGRVVVRLRDRGPCRQRRVLRVDKKVIDPGNRTVVPLKLPESIIGKAASDAAHAWISNTLIRTLSCRQRSSDAQHAEVTSKARQEVFEKRDWRHGSYGRTLIAKINQLPHRVVPRHTRLRIADVIERGHVALRQQVARKSADVGGLDLKAFGDFTLIRESRAVVIRSRNAAIERCLDPLGLVRRLSQRERK